MQRNSKIAFNLFSKRSLPLRPVPKKPKFLEQSRLPIQAMEHGHRLITPQVAPRMAVSPMLVGCGRRGFFSELGIADCKETEVLMNVKDGVYLRPKFTAMKSL